MPDPRPNTSITVVAPTGHIVDSDIAELLSGDLTISVAYPDSVPATEKGARTGGAPLALPGV